MALLVVDGRGWRPNPPPVRRSHARRYHYERIKKMDLEKSLKIASDRHNLRMDQIMNYLGVDKKRAIDLENGEALEMGSANLNEKEMLKLGIASIASYSKALSEIMDAIDDYFAHEEELSAPLIQHVRLNTTNIMEQWGNNLKTIEALVANVDPLKTMLDAMEQELRWKKEGKYEH